MKIVLSGNLRRYTDFEGEVEVTATSVLEALNALVQRHPDLQPVLFEGNGQVRSVHRLYLNGDVLEIDEIDRTLDADDELGILTAIAGG